MPVRLYHRVRLGKNTGVVFSSGGGGRKSGSGDSSGCIMLGLKALYWIYIGWWFVPLRWFFRRLPGWVSWLAGQIAQRTSLEHTTAKLILWASLALGLVTCGLITYLQSQTPQAVAARAALAATMTAEAIPTLTVTPLPTITAAPTVTAEPTITPAPTQPVLSPTPCDCGFDYKCDNFRSSYAAQTCFDSCGGGAFSGLDNDGDGHVCEK